MSQINAESFDMGIQTLRDLLNAVRNNTTPAGQPIGLTEAQIAMFECELEIALDHFGLPNE